MSNSKLISGTLLTNNCSKPRNHVIDRITPHYMCWYTDAKTCCESFVPASRKASANYCIGKDGEIWLNVDESNRAWTSGSAYNDNRAVTIECANYMDSANYGRLPDRTWNSLILLCADICRRNNITAMNYTGDDKGNLTMHKWYQDTDCPGPWLSKMFGELAKAINDELKQPTPTPTPIPAIDYSGEYVVNCDALNVRVAPTVNSKCVAQYKRGQTVIVENWRTVVNNIVWTRYKGLSSGEYRYIAVGVDTGKAESNDYLIKL